MDDLLRHTAAEVWIGARRTGRLVHLQGRLDASFAPRVRAVACDLADRDTLDPLVSQVQVAVCAAGPFQDLPLTLLECCVAHGVPYVDLADDRGFYVRARDWAAGRDASRLPPLCVGWSAVPALSGVMTRCLVADLEEVDSIFVQIAPGNRAPRSRSTVASLLASLGRPFRIWSAGAWTEVRGWSRPTVFEFPPPVGRRFGSLVDVPDHEIFPQLFGARTVEFRVGPELWLLNMGATALAALSRRFGIHVERWARWLAPAMRVLGPFGHDWGAVGVLVLVTQGNRGVLRRMSVVARHAGQRIPVMPAAVMAARLISGQGAPAGLVPVDDWLTRADLEGECARRGFDLVVEELPDPRDLGF